MTVVQDDFYENQTPIGLLQSLKVLGDFNSTLNGRFTLPNANKGWVTSQDVLILFESVGNPDACLHAENYLSSIASPAGYSTVDVEARRLIHSYVSGVYPPVNPDGLSVEQLKSMVLQKFSEEIDEKLRLANQNAVPALRKKE